MENNEATVNTGDGTLSDRDPDVSRCGIGATAGPSGMNSNYNPYNIPRVTTLVNIL